MVYVEFRDPAPSQMTDTNTVGVNLASLCRIEDHQENNSSKIIFDVGFLRGASLAKNVTERLLVRTLARAYLRLLEVENEDTDVRRVEALAVPNDEARQFHIFRTHDYRDYVRDSLSGELVKIEAIDDAAARVGLAWGLYSIVTIPEWQTG